MTLYSYNRNYPETIPFRIRLSDGSTRTDPTTFSIYDISDAGYTEVPDMPVPSSTQKVCWDAVNINWILEDKTLEELQAETDALWNQIRDDRDNRIAAVAWRYERYARHQRLGIKQVDEIKDLDIYIQSLADIPQTQTDPYNIVWPVLTSNKD
jgi:hypothetical protein